MSYSTGLQFAPEPHQYGSNHGYRENHDGFESKVEHLTSKPSALPCRRVFRRPRAGRACGVRCDAGSHGIPCTNCEAFFLDCSIPPRKKNSTRGEHSAGGRKRSPISIVKQRGHSNDDGNGDGDVHGGDNSKKEKDGAAELLKPVASNPDDFASLILQADQHIKQQPDSTKQYVKLLNHLVSPSAIANPGKVAYLQEKSSLALLIKDYYGSTDAVHYPLPMDAANQRMATKLNPEEMDILRKRGALELPPRDLCEELIHAYFKWIAPVVPIIPRTWFMKRWHDLNNQPSLLLLQAVLLAGSRVCTTPLMLDANGSPIPAATTFYKRAKALYDADYEEDRVVIVQALILLGWYWEEPGVVTKTVFYWNGLATTIAQGFGMHRNPSGSRLSPADKRLWKRIWWTLYTRDRSVAVAVGRPAHINLEHSDLEMIQAEDFIDDHTGPEDEVRVLFFLQYVKICEITDDILYQHYSLQSPNQGSNSLNLQQCDQALNDWIRNCPTQVRWSSLNKDKFWPAYLHLIYLTTRCLLFRAYLPSVKQLSELHEKPDISQHAAFQSAIAVTSLTEDIISRGELRHAPPFLIYAIRSALTMHIYELQLHSPLTNTAARRRICVCMSALDTLSDIWLVAKMVQGFFEAILQAAKFGNYTLETTKRFKQIGEHKVPVFSFVEEPLSKNKLATKSKDDGLPLTQALLAHQKATLGFASGTGTSTPIQPKKPATISKSVSAPTLPSVPQVKQQFVPTMHQEGDFPIPNEMWATAALPTPMQETVQYQDPVFFGNMNYIPPEQMANWMQPDFQNMIPTTLNVADWLDYFGMR
ncbi:hypothetical protein EYC84_002450 [Monilinia fructicola]|uniref:Xylanolytic transcriptional activator regulatory domain-containing protein n=1 Tax=Monilinia fructicola TaxID=38448 RepID=A0A5M9JKU1_MONFR|nr:hypothetical protein EYC84_002450 [Monilinia fructicola]